MVDREARQNNGVTVVELLVLEGQKELVGTERTICDHLESGRARTED